MTIIAKQAAEICESTLRGEAGKRISDLLIDSRRVSELSGETMFIALKGEKNDGHRYIGEMYDAGVRVFLVSDSKFRNVKKEQFPGASFIISEDSLAALQKLAAWKRREYRGCLISITGSNGKTIVKEWLSDILSHHRDVVRSPRSYNSQVGVPLSLWKLNNDYDTAVIEAGMSMPGEIARLEKMIKPRIGVFTHIGEAHQENFGSLEEKIYEKLSLFVDSEVIIFPEDKKEISGSIRSDRRFEGKKLFSWSSKRGEADLVITQSGVDETMLKVIHGDTEFNCPIPFHDKASIDNISTLITIMLYLDTDRDDIIEGVKQLQAVAMRMEQKEGINNCLLLEDCYNSDPGSLRIAMDYLKGISDKDMTVVLSDFIQSSKNSGRLYEDVAEDLRKTGVKKLIGIGGDISSYAECFKVPEKQFFIDTDAFIRSFNAAYFNSEAVLLKGARVFEFERIGRLLELKTHQTSLEIDLNAVLANLNTFRTYIKKQTRLMAMVKAFAYGAGPKEISEWLIYNGVDYLAVAYPDEGISLRKSGLKCRIMVMNPDNYSLVSLLDYDLEPEIYSRSILEAFIREARRFGVRDYPIHIKIDTGMHRLGFMESEIDGMINTLRSTETLRIASAFSHLAAAYDDAQDAFTHEQAAMFSKICDKIEERTGESFIRHLLNSAGTVRFPEYQFDMVRLGIGLYGISEVSMKGLVNACSFYTRISQVKKIGRGEGLGYGLKDKAERERKIAILPVGYADGLSRQMGQGRGRVYADGHHLPIVGNVCMDMCMIDISDTNLNAGDVIEIFGDNIPVNETASVCGTIPYEIISGIPARVKRVYLYE